MAQNKKLFSMIFLLALIIFCQGFHSIEGRNLKSDEGFQSLPKNEDGDKVVHGGVSTTTAANHVSPPTPPSKAAGATIGVPPPPGGDVNDFRPTRPMAQNKTLLSFIFLVALIIFYQGFQFIEGRYLRSGEGYQNLSKNEDGGKVVYGGISITNAANYVSPPTPLSEAVGATTGVPPPPRRDVNDFRSTAPGHSPGVGHSIYN